MTERLHTFAELGDTHGDYGAATAVVRQLMNRMATATLVKVKKVSADTVDVQPMVHQIDGDGKATDHGTIHAIPWFALRAGNSAVLLKPKVGDIGLAIFCHSDISKVKKTKAPATPGSRRRFDWADALYLGGFLGPTPTQFITVDDDTGITITGTSSHPVTINAPGGLTINGDITLTGKLTASDDVIASGKSLKSHTHGGIQTGSGTSGPPS
ncbi:MAG: hypothetical protein KGM49_00655 [Sphingomonadales bacterium]|nr:hypothetical protein [Sphingomonadales bacterium]